MLAMCVRKTADTGTPTSIQAPVHHITNSTSSTTSTGSTAKRKLKALRSRGSGSTKKHQQQQQQQQQQAAETSSVTLMTASTSSSSSTALKKHHHGHGGAVEKKTTTTGTCSTVDVDCTVKVRDDAEGHLIYRKGDVVDSRCKFVTCEYEVYSMMRD